MAKQETQWVCDTARRSQPKPQAACTRQDFCKTLFFSGLYEMIDNSTIRSATVDDVEAIGELWERMAEQHQRYDSSVWCWSDDAPVSWKRDCRERIGKDDCFCLVAEIDGTLAGFARGCVTQNPAIFQIRKSGELWDIFIHEDYRGHGLGRKLLQAVEQAARDAGAEDMKFHVALSNPAAVEFYKHLGYQPAMYRMYKRIVR